MCCRPLHVKQVVLNSRQLTDQMDQCDLGGVALSAEHRLSGKKRPDRNPIQTPSQTAVVVPGLHRVQPPEAEQLHVGVLDLRRDPTMGTSGIGATVDHSGRVEIEAHVESAQGTSEGPADLEVARWYHSPLDWRPPGEFAVGQVHREHALAVTRKDRSGSQIGAHRDNVVRTRSPGVRQPKQTGSGLDRQAFPFQQPDGTSLCDPLSLGSLSGDQGATITTHAVLNQPPPLDRYDLAAAEPTLVDALERDDAGWAVDMVTEFGRRVASPEVYEWGFLANRHPPELRTHDRYGNRIDQVEFHPAWHSLLDMSVSYGLHSLPWEPSPPKAGHLVRTSLTFLASQVEAGHFCPISMTYAALPALRQQPNLAAVWEPKVVARAYDPRFRTPSEKSGLLMGMGMTEKQGGSDVRAGTTQAVPAEGDYLITGHKWFMSAPMNDAFLILAQAPGGLTCFLLPRFRPDGTVNAIRIQRLKDKLGNRSNASAEVEFEQAFASKVGEEGRGVSTIIEMVNGTRLDCVTGSAALMRQAVSQAIHHCRFRRVFGSALIDQPAMLNVLADLEVETEAAAMLMTRLATSFDRSSDDPREQALRRIATPLAKFWVTKRCSEVVHEALECLGGNGFVEETILPRLYRESPLNAIWEGSGNVIALDVLRAAQANPGSVDALADEMALGAGFDRRIEIAAASAIDLLRNLTSPPAQARLVTERLGIAWQASLLARFGRPEVAAAFVRSRLSPEGGRTYGTLPADSDLVKIIQPAIPRIADE